MSTTIITGFDVGPVFLFGANSTVNVKKGATLMLGGNLGGMGGTIGTIMENFDSPSANHDNTFNIDGTVLGMMIGILTAGARDRITIGETGSVQGEYGVAVAGQHSVVVNNGEVISSAVSGTEGGALYAYEALDVKITNNGLAVGENGIAYQGAKGTIVNGVNGIVEGNDAGVAIADALGTTRFTNHGLVTGASGIAVSVQGDAVVVNDGRIRGSVVFQSGDQTLDTRGGTLSKAQVTGGEGDDTLITDNAHYHLKENSGEGTDTVKSTVTYALSANVEKLTLLGTARINGTGTDDANAIHGNAGKNFLQGMGGDDDLFGGKGTDRLKGGDGGDTFHFVTGDGNDTITDFVSGVDTIDVSHWTGIDTFKHLKSHAADGDHGLVITMGDDTLTIANLTRNHLDSGDFTFPA